jgi:hypothetical protein
MRGKEGRGGRGGGRGGRLGVWAAAEGSSSLAK